MSPLLPRDRTLHITINNTFYALTPMVTDNATKPYHLHLFLNLHNHMPYLRHTRKVDEWIAHHLDIITSLPCTRPQSTRTRCRHMKRTTTYVPGLITTVTLPTVSTQDQLSIITLATHLLLTVPYLQQTQQSWNIVGQVGSHQHFI